jgi:hypothetical protein
MRGELLCFFIGHADDEQHPSDHDADHHDAHDHDAGPQAQVQTGLLSDGGFIAAKRRS